MTSHSPGTVKRESDLECRGESSDSGGMALDLDLDYISGLCNNGAGPPQATPNYWSVHTHPKPRPRDKNHFISAPTFGSVITPQQAGTAREERQSCWNNEGLFTLWQEGRTGQDVVGDRCNSAPRDADH